jgi:hypothetical protein
LDKRQLAQARAARRITVNLEVPGVPGRCDRLESRKLVLEHKRARRIVWAQAAG